MALRDPRRKGCHCSSEYSGTRHWPVPPADRTRATPNHRHRHGRKRPASSFSCVSELSYRQHRVREGICPYRAETGQKPPDSGRLWPNPGSAAGWKAKNCATQSYWSVRPECQAHQNPNRRRIAGLVPQSANTQSGLWSRWLCWIWKSGEAFSGPWQDWYGVAPFSVSQMIGPYCKSN